jgi:hypothetical protein
LRVGMVGVGSASVVDVGVPMALVWYVRTGVAGSVRCATAESPDERRRSGPRNQACAAKP